MGGRVLVDESGLILEMGVLLAGADECGQLEVVVQHHLANQVIIAIVVLSLVPNRSRARDATG